MFTTNQTQRTTWNETPKNDLNRQVEAFLLDRRIRGLAPGTLRLYSQKLALFQAFCDDQDIDIVMLVSPILIRQFLLWLSQTGHNNGGVHGFYRALRAFLNWWEEEYEPDNWRNPIRKVKGPKLKTDPLPPAEWDTIRMMVASCMDDKTAHRDKALLLFLVDTGLRASETLSLETDDYDAITGTVRVRKGKGGKGRTVYVGKQTRRAIRIYLKSRKSNGPLWQTVGGERLSYDGLRAYAETASKQRKTNFSWLCTWLIDLVPLLKTDGTPCYVQVGRG